MSLENIDNLIATPDGDHSWGSDMRGVGSVVRTNFLSRIHQFRGQAGISTWSGSTWTWTGNLNIIPGLRASTYVTAGSVTLTAWDLAYIRLTTAQWGNAVAQTDTAIAPADILVADYTAYIPSPNDIPLAFCNGNDGRLYLADGQTLDYWRVATYENGWKSHGASWFPASYYKDANGFVHLRGLVNGGTLGTSAFTLPAEYRNGVPGGGTTNVHYIGRTSTGLGTANINAQGNVILYDNNTWWDLGSLPPFRAEA